MVNTWWALLYIQKGKRKKCKWASGDLFIYLFYLFGFEFFNVWRKTKKKTKELQYHETQKTKLQLSKQRKCIIGLYTDWPLKSATSYVSKFNKRGNKKQCEVKQS